MLRRKRLAMIAGWMLAIMLFSQAALSAAPCLGERSPALAIAAAEAMPCCPEAQGEGGTRSGNANVCLAHCTADAQNVDAHLPTLPDAPLQAVLLVQTPPPSQRLALSHAIARDEVPPAPPPLILFKHFLI